MGLKFFEYDSPIMSFFSKVFDLVCLNMLALIFSIPLITIGAAMTATHYTALKLHRNEGNVWKSFFKSFRENLRQSTIIWLIIILCGAVSVVTYNVGIHISGMYATVLRGVVLTMLILTVLLYAWVIPLQAKFINPISATFKNAIYLAFKHLFRTLLMVVLSILPVGTFVLIVYVTGMRGMGVWLTCGISVPVYLCAVIYHKVFERLEELV